MKIQIEIEVDENLGDLIVVGDLAKILGSEYQVPIKVKEIKMPDFKEEEFCEWKIDFETEKIKTSCGREYHLPTRIATYATCKCCSKPIKEIK